MIVAAIVYIAGLSSLAAGLAAGKGTYNGRLAAVNLYLVAVSGLALAIGAL